MPNFLPIYASTYSSYQSTILAAGGTHYFIMNDAKATGTAKDSLGSITTGVYGSAPQIGPTLRRGGNSPSLSGGKISNTSSYLTIPNTTSLLSAICTLEMLVYWTSGQSGNNLFAANANTSTTFTGFRLGTFSTGQIFVITGNGTSSVTAQSSSGACPVGVPFHLAFTYSTPNLLLYLNGVQVGSASLASATPQTGDSGLNCNFGLDQAYANYLDGYISDVATYSTALSAATLLAHANAR